MKLLAFSWNNARGDPVEAVGEALTQADAMWFVAVGFAIFLAYMFWWCSRKDEAN